MRVQLARLFGATSSEAKAMSRTDAEWKKTLKRVLAELDQYIAENVDTDEVHYLMLLSGLISADEALKEKDFWPGYVEGITRFSLCLLGHYPDHRRRKAGRKSTRHYNLQHFRSIHLHQNRLQRLYTLYSASEYGFPPLTKDPREALREFRSQYGYKRSYMAFFKWYRKTYPQDYSAVF